MADETVSGAQALDLLFDALRLEAQYDDPESDLFPPCSPEAMDTLDLGVKEKFGVSLPNGYKLLLRRTDGVCLQDIEVYGTTRRRKTFVEPPPDFDDPAVFVSSLVDENEALRDHDASFRSFVVYGQTESDWLVFNLATQRFEQRDTVCHDCGGTFGTFEELLWWTIGTRHPLPPIKFADA